METKERARTPLYAKNREAEPRDLAPAAPTGATQIARAERRKWRTGAFTHGCRNRAGTMAHQTHTNATKPIPFLYNPPPPPTTLPSSPPFFLSFFLLLLLFPFPFLSFFTRSYWPCPARVPLSEKEAKQKRAELTTQPTTHIGTG
jgi:hypothetical protein